MCVVQDNAAPVVDPIERAERHKRRKRPNRPGCGLKTGGQEQPAPLSVPDIVHIARHNDSRLVVRPLQQLPVEDPPDLNVSFETGQSQVRVDHQQAMAMTAMTGDLAAPDQRPTPFFERDRQLDVVHVGQREPAEDGISVRPLAKLDIGLKRPVRKSQGVANQIDLAVMPRPGDTIVHLLQQHDIGTMMLQCLDDPLGTVASINATDPLVDIVGDQVKSHGVWFFHSLGACRILMHPVISGEVHNGR
jgi:hypothetical protein